LSVETDICLACILTIAAFAGGVMTAHAQIEAATQMFRNLI